MRISSLKNLPYEPVSHDPELKKKVLAKGVPCMERLSHIVLVPGNKASMHTHEKHHEVFYFIRGEALFRIEDKDVHLKKGDCLVVEPGERHSIEEVFEETEMVYFLAGR